MNTANSVLFGAKYKGQTINPSRLSKKTLDRAVSFELAKREIEGALDALKVLPANDSLAEAIKSDMAKVGDTYQLTKDIPFEAVLAGEGSAQEIDALIRATNSSEEENEQELAGESIQLFTEKVAQSLQQGWQALTKAGLTLPLLVSKKVIGTDFAKEVEGLLK
ncbi:MAG TPA: hypothetical protein V6C52_09070 [Coleofasciculaceae cyanobacterium]|jgi:hypothetical protein